MCTVNIICVEGRFGVYSFSSGFAFKRQPDLREEWRANPNAVFERLARLGQWEELEVLMDWVPVPQ